MGTSYAKHTVLRTAVFGEELDIPVQCVYDRIPLPLQELDFTALKEEEIPDAFTSFLETDREKGFTFETAPLFRITLIKIDKGHTRFVFTGHHIILDGWSVQNLIAGFYRYYMELETGRALSPPVLDDFGVHLRHISTINQAEGLSYWKNYLSKLKAPSYLPFVKDTSLRNKVFGKEKMILDFSGPIQEYTKKYRVTRNTLIQGAWSYLLSRYTGVEEVVFGATISGRDQKEENVESKVGLYLNTIPVCSAVDGNKKIADWLQELQEEHTIGREEYGHLGISEIEAQSAVKRTLFDSAITFQNFPEAASSSGFETKVSVENIKGIESSNFTLSLVVYAKEDDLKIVLQYNDELVSKDAVHKIKGHLETLLKSLLSDVQYIKDLNYLTEAETDQLLNEFNNTEKNYVGDNSIIEVFSQTVLDYPQRLALVFEGQKLSYKELDERSNQVAQYLVSEAKVSGGIVGLLFDRSVDMVIGIIGVLKAGAGYLPLDPNLPKKRIAYMLDQSGASFLISGEEYVEEYASRIPVQAMTSERISNQSKSMVGVNTSISDIAYCIFTSGSTGEPKGVVMSQKSVINLVAGLKENVYSAYGDKGMNVALLASYSFDASVQQIFGALLQGNSLFVVDDESRKDGAKLLSFYNENTIDVSDGTPTHLGMLLESTKENIGLNSLSSWILAGEALSKTQVETFYSRFGTQTQLYNFYGPTEACVDSTCYKVIADQLNQYDSIPIGRPLPNERVYVTDNYGRLVPVGAIGELCIAGDGLAQGYIGKEELTKERFVSDWVIGEECVYRTGDMVRWLTDGNLEYHGRKDSQVKLRGYRIELSEVEYQLNTYKEIENGIVLIKTVEGEKHLVAYYQAKMTVQVSEIREHLSVVLPDYMVPSYYVHIEEFPLTINGKIDRVALPEPTVNLEETYVAASNEIEEKLIEIYAEALKLDSDVIGVDSNFFDLGGHSLNMIFLSNKIQKEFGVKISLKEMMKHPTVRHLSNLLPQPETVDYQGLRPAEKREYYPLSSAQKRMYFLHEYNKDSLAYNIPVVVTLKGTLDTARLENAFKKLIQRHNSLRTLFDVVDGVPVQRILPKVDFSLEEIVEGVDIKETINNFIRPFDLTAPPLWRTGVIQQSNQENILIMDTHHIISDEVTNEVLLKDLIALYKGETLPELQLQYEDYVMWQLEETQQEEVLKHKKYWEGKFSDDVPILQLPYDKARPKDRSDKGGNHLIKLDVQKLRALKAIARSEEATMYSLVLALYNILLNKLSNQRDIVVGTPISGREHADLEGITGIFINTLAIRNTVDDNQSFKSFLRQVQQENSIAFDHQSYPYEELIDTLDLEMDTSRSPLFDVLMSYAYEKEKLDFGDSGLQVEAFDVPYDIAKFDLTLTTIETGEQLILNFSFCKDLFEKESIERFASYFVRIIDAVVDNKEQLLKDIDILSETEKQQLLCDFNATDKVYDLNKTVLDLFEIQVAKTPNADALIFNNQKATYYELNARADQWATYLSGKGIVRGSRVGLLMSPSTDMITSILAILKAGAAYVPIDPKQPISRTAHILEDSNCHLIISNLKKNEQLDKIGMEVVFTHNLDAYVPIHGMDSKTPLSSEDLAYIIYTSGSTGKPKGVMTHHEAISNLIYGQKDNFGIDHTDRILQSSPYYFDASVEQIWLALTSGGTLVLKKTEELLNTDALNKVLQDYEITHLHNTPSFLERIDFSKSKSLKRVVAGGEACSPGLANKMSSSNDFYNEYGPTETTVTSIMYHVASGNNVLEDLPIGKPLPNTKVYILDAASNLTPIGVVGELFIAGKGVSTGYLNREEQTEEHFLENPFGEGRLYKTGDLAKWGSDGNITFVGRSDDQVKLNGVRIELGEIKNQLRRHKNISDVETVLSDVEGQPTILAYYIAKSKCDDSALRIFLMERLPLSMIPSHFIHLESFPLTPSGKLSRKLLPSPQTNAAVYKKPETEIEKKLASIWSNILSRKMDEIGADSSFFELGGNSLRAILLSNMLNKEFSVRIELKALFQHQTISSLAKHITEIDNETFEAIPIAPSATYYPLSSAQRRMFFLYEYDKKSLAYNPAMIVRLKGILNLEKLEESFKTLVSRHESFRTSFEFIDGVPLQRISKGVDFSIAYLDVEKDVNTSIKDFIVPFDLSEAPLIRVGILRVSDTEHIMVINNHHIISDGVSDGILLNEFMAVYKGESLPPLRIQYKDYAVWQNSEVQQEQLQSHKEYWLDVFHGELPILELPTDRSRPEVPSTHGGLVTFAFNKETTDQLSAIAKEEQTTLFVILLSLYNIFLAKLSNSEDIIVGTSVSGRNHADLDEVTGVFINALALRNSPKGNQSYEAFLKSVKHNVLSAFEHQEYPYEDLIDALKLKRDTSRPPLFNVMFEYFNFEQPELLIPGLTLETVDYEFDVTRFDLTFGVTEVEEGLSFRFQYSSELFDHSTIERFVGYFRQLTETILKDRSSLLKEINILSINEQNELINGFNFEESAYNSDLSLIDFFKESVSLYPERIAVRYGQEYLTYKELDIRSNKIAQYLHTKNIGFGNVVALLLDRSIDIVVGILGVLKSGAAYMPIDPTLPEQRISYMLDQSRASFLLSEHMYMETYSAYLPVSSINRILLTSISEEELKIKVTSADLAYCIFTSGSSGKPKGVMMAQEAVVNLIKGLEQKVYAPYKGQNLKVALLASYAFDASVQQIFGSLFQGHSLFIADDESRKDGQKLQEFYNANNIDISDGTPTHLRLLVNAMPLGGSLPNLKAWILAGEVLPKELVHSFFKKAEAQVQLYNFYGPTEACVDSTVFKVNPKKLNEYASIPIGKPLPNERVYVTDQYGSLVPKGTRGELCIAGSGLARCYAGNQELTTERFISNWLPWESRVYRTGDMVKWLPDGNLEYCGRMDDQIKLRGYRVELSEITHQMNALKGIYQSIVMVKEKDGEHFLVGYYEAEEELAINDVRKKLSESLPEYMIPNYFVYMEKFPVSLSGKVDVNSFPEYELRQSKLHIPPSNDIERELVAIWAEVLKVDQEVIGVTTDFFDLGGHSLTGIQIANTISEHFGVNLKLVEIFKKRTVREISELIEMSKWLDKGQTENKERASKETVI